MAAAPVLFDPLMIPVLQGGAEPDPANPGTPLMDPGGGATALANGYQLTDGTNVFTLINGSTRLTQRINAGETTLAQWSTGTKPPFQNDGPLPPPPATGGTGTGTGAGTGTGTGGTGAGTPTTGGTTPPPATFQDVRGAMQKLTSDALTTGGVPFADQVFDNVQETPPQDSSGTYAKINISFPETVLETIGCDGAERILGTCNVLVYTPKGKGMKPAEDIMQAVIKEWVRVNRALVNERSLHLKTRNVEGPNALAPDQRPHQVTQLSCAFTARVA